jgi:hypothetical protein
MPPARRQHGSPPIRPSRRTSNGSSSSVSVACRVCVSCAAGDHPTSASTRDAGRPDGCPTRGRPRDGAGSTGWENLDGVRTTHFAPAVQHELNTLSSGFPPRFLPRRPLVCPGNPATNCSSSRLTSDAAQVCLVIGSYYPLVLAAVFFLFLFSLKQERTAEDRLCPCGPTGDMWPAGPGAIRRVTKTPENAPVRHTRPGHSNRRIFRYIGGILRALEDLVRPHENPLST